VICPTVVCTRLCSGDNDVFPVRLADFGIVQQGQVLSARMSPCYFETIWYAEQRVGDGEGLSSAETEQKEHSYLL